jgi:hypothetical protein
MHTSRIAVTALLLVPMALRAEELDLGVTSHVLWTENADGASEDAALNENDDPNEDFSLRITPSVAVRDPDGELTWSLRYHPSYEAYFDESERNGFDQAVSAGAAWQFAERWSISLQESYFINQSTVRFNESAAPGEEVTLGFRDQEVRNNRTSAALTHTLTPLDTLSLSASYVRYEYPDGNRSDRSIPSSSLAYDHLFSERTTAGLRFSWTQQANQGNVEGDDETTFYNLSGTLSHSFSPTFHLQASAGPTLVDSSPRSSSFETPEFAVLRIVTLDPMGNVRGPFAADADLCEFAGVPRRAASFSTDCVVPTAGDFPTEITPAEFQTLVRRPEIEVPTLDEQGNLFEDSTATDLTYFARLVLMKDWEYWKGSLGYQRSNSESSRLGSSSVGDTIFAHLTWLPGPFWTVDFGASVGLQQQASDQGFPVAFQLENAPAPTGVTSVPQVAQITGVILSDSDVEYWTQSLSLRVNRRLTRRSSAFVSANWYAQRQEVGSPIDQTTRWENLTLSIGFVWSLEPIRF